MKMNYEDFIDINDRFPNKDEIEKYSSIFMVLARIDYDNLLYYDGNNTVPLKSEFPERQYLYIAKYDKDKKEFEIPLKDGWDNIYCKPHKWAFLTIDKEKE